MLDPRSRLADSPVLPGAVISVGSPGPDYHRVRGAAAGTLHVTSGPDAGFGVALQPGRHTIGRATDSSLCLHDTDVSRRHAVIDVFPDGRAAISDVALPPPEAPPRNPAAMFAGGTMGVVTGIVLALTTHQKALIAISFLSVLGTVVLYLIENPQRKQRRRPPGSGSSPCR